MTTRQLVSARVDVELWRRVRVACLSRGVSAASAVEEALTVWLSREVPAGMAGQPIGSRAAMGPTGRERQMMERSAAKSLQRPTRETEPDEEPRYVDDDPVA